MLRFFQSLGHAIRGIVFAVRSQRHMRFHLMAAAAVAAAGCAFKLSRDEWCLIVLSCGLVLAAEVANTAVEKLADRITEEKDERIGLAKDAAAGAVLLAAIAAAAVGVIVFGPRLADLLK